MTTNSHTITSPNPAILLTGYLLLLSILVLAAGAAHAGQVALAWGASPSSTVTGYTLSYGTASGVYTNHLSAGNNLSITAGNLQDGGTYFFAVKAYDAAGNQSSYSNEVSTTLPAALTADFSVSAGTTDAGNAVTFTPVSTVAVSSWRWDFGDGSSALTGTNSVVPKATKSFNTAGNYIVTLTVGTIVQSKAIAVRPVAGFNASSVTGQAPVTVSFADASLGSPTAWNWSFGDGGTSTTQNPSHTFAAAGTYTVSLAVSGAGLQSGNTATQTITVAAPPVVVTPTASLAAAFAFDEAKGTLVADASGNGNTGTLVNAPVWSTGKFGTALGFGLGQFVTVPNTSTLDLGPNGLSVSFFAKITDYGRDQVLVGKPWNTTFTSPWYQFGVEYSASAKKIVLYLGDTAGVPHAYSMPAPMGVWTHIAYTYDGATVKGYVDGALQVSVAGGFRIPANGLPVRVGLDPVGNQPTNGALDEIRLYNGALSQAEIASHAAAGVSRTNPPRQLAGDQTEGPVVYALPMGVAKAFPVVAANDGLITAVPVYVDTGSSASKLIVGIYKDKAGHPGTRLATTTLAVAAAGKWNSIPVGTVPVAAGTKYWLAILSPRVASAPIVYLRDVAGSGGVVESSPKSTLTSLPSSWSVGKQVYDGPLSLYGAGY